MQKPEGPPKLFPYNLSMTIVEDIYETLFLSSVLHHGGSSISTSASEDGKMFSTSSMRRCLHDPPSFFRGFQKLRGPNWPVTIAIKALTTELLFVSQGMGLGISLILTVPRALTKKLLL